MRWNIWKSRQAKPRRIKGDFTIMAMFSTSEPKWQDWIMWAYPIVNASFFTPAVVLTAATATYSTYLLIALNFSLFGWHVGQTLFNLLYDHGNRKRHVLQFLIISGFAVLGVYLALLALPLALPGASPAVVAFFIANFVTTCANFAASVCNLILPWVLSGLSRLFNSLRGAPKGITPLPNVLIDQCEASKDFSNHSDDVINLAKVLAEHQLQGSKESDQEACARYRLKVINSSFALRNRKVSKLAGLLREAALMDKLQSNANEVVEGRLTTSSDAATFFFGLSNKNMMKLSFDLARLTVIHEASQNINNDKDRLVSFLQAVDHRVTIDGLNTALSIMRSTEKSPVEILNDYISFESEPKDLDGQVKSIVKIADDILAELIQVSLIKLHDEEALTVEEIAAMLKEKYFKYEPNSISEGLVKKSCDNFKTFLRERENYGQTICPIPTHSCLGAHA